MARIKELLFEYWQYVALGLLAVSAGIIWLSGHREPAETPVAMSTSVQTSVSSTSSASSQSTASSSSGYVYISGAVRHPGLYHVTAGTRWADVVQQAGGLTKDADTAPVNLAQIAHDQENLAVPVRGSTSVSAGGSSAGSGTARATNQTANAASSSGPVINLNTATVTDLQQISGIGPKRAQDIIDYRDQHGGFKTVDELKEISGIGDKTFADLQPSVTVGP